MSAALTLTYWWVGVSSPAAVTLRESPWVCWTAVGHEPGLGTQLIVETGVDSCGC